MSTETIVSPENIFNTLWGFQRTAALKTGIDLDIFTAIGEGDRTAAALARKSGASERGIRILCDYLTIIGLLGKSGRVLRADARIGDVPEQAISGIYGDHRELSNDP